MAVRQRFGEADHLVIFCKIEHAEHNFVANGIVVHNCESEESRRYISSTPVLYIPEEFRASAPSVKQGSAGKHATSDYWKMKYTEQCNAAIDLYERMLNAGICPEQARFILPQGCEVNWVWTGSLYAFANFYNQRSDGHAQKEIQELAEQVGKIIEPLFPISWSALTAGNY